jgi:hypothetical protein
VCEWEFEVDSFYSVFSDPDLFEECLVVGASELVGCLFVGF